MMLAIMHWEKPLNNLKYDLHRSKRIRKCILQPSLKVTALKIVHKKVAHQRSIIALTRVLLY